MPPRCNADARHVKCDVKLIRLLQLATHKAAAKGYQPPLQQHTAQTDAQPPLHRTYTPLKAFTLAITHNLGQ